MTRRLLSLAAGVLPEFRPEEMAAAAVAAGWSAVGIWIDPATWTDATAAEVRSRAADGGIEILDVEVIWLKPGGNDDDHRRVIDAGATIGARHALAVSSEPDAGLAAHRLGRLADHARGSGLRVSLEFAAFTEVRTLAAARAILETPGCEALDLLIDPLHLARTGGTPAMLEGFDSARLPYAQFCDASATGPSLDDITAIVHEALDLRLDVGTGGLPLAALRDILPSGTPFSIELRSKVLRDTYPDAVDRARALLTATGQGLAAL